MVCRQRGPELLPHEIFQHPEMAGQMVEVLLFLLDLVGNHISEAVPVKKTRPLQHYMLYNNNNSLLNSLAVTY